MQPASIASAAKELSQFFTGPYPENWFGDGDGESDGKSDGMGMVMVDFKVLSGMKGRWVKSQDGESAILVDDRGGFSAPGLMVGMLPLFVGERGEGACGEWER